MLTFTGGPLDGSTNALLHGEATWLDHNYYTFADQDGKPIMIAAVEHCDGEWSLVVQKGNGESSDMGPLKMGPSDGTG